METIKMEQNRLLFCILALICFTMFTSCNNDEEQNEETSLIPKGLMLVSPINDLGYTEIGGGAGVAHEGKFWFLDVLEFNNNHTIYHYHAFRTGTKDGIFIHNHEDWVRFPKDFLSIYNYVVDERDSILSITYSTDGTYPYAYTMKCVNGKLYSLISEDGYEVFYKWEDGETYWSQKYDEEHKDNH